MPSKGTETEPANTSLLFGSAWVLCTVQVLFMAEVPVYDVILEVIQNVQTCLRVDDLPCRSVVEGEGNGVGCGAW
jgi:hypothetical protein